MLLRRLQCLRLRWLGLHPALIVWESLGARQRETLFDNKCSRALVAIKLMLKWQRLKMTQIVKQGAKDTTIRTLL